MYKFITIRCRSCGSVIYNLPESDFKKLRLVNLTCEDCRDHSELDDTDTGKEVLVYKDRMKAV